MAASGAIGRNAFNEKEVALELLDYLIPHYPELLKVRYKAAEIVMYEFRQATLGRITLETPTEFQLLMDAGQQLDAERQVKKDDMELKRLIKLKSAASGQSRPTRSERELESRLKAVSVTRAHHAAGVGDAKADAQRQRKPANQRRLRDDALHAWRLDEVGRDQHA